MARRSRTAPSRSPHSLTTRPRSPSRSTSVESTSAPMGSRGARRAWKTGQGHPGVEVQGGQAVGQFGQLPGGYLDLVDRRGGARAGRRPVQAHGQAGQRPDRAAAGDHPLGGLRRGGQHLGDGTGPLGGQIGDGGPLGDREPVPVSSSPRIRAVPRGTLATALTESSVPIPASRLPPPRSRPSTGRRPTHTPARWPRKHSRASSSPLSNVIGLRRIRSIRPMSAARCRRRAGRRWPAPPPRRRRRPRRPRGAA